MHVVDLFHKAQEEGFAIGAFNVGDSQMVKAVVQAAWKLSSPVIIETSSGETQFIGAKNLVSIVENYRWATGLPLFVNLDHSFSLSLVEEGLKSGYDLVHFDGSDLPLKENIGKTLDIVAWAHLQGVPVEAEIDKITGESKPHRETAESVQAAGVYTDPEKASRFVEETGADILAVFVGNVHGVYQNPIRLDFERLRLIREKVSCFFSLHGGSGIPEEEIKKAIKTGGIVKINVSTELRVAYRQALEKVLEGSEEVAPYKLMAPVVEAVQKIVEEKIKIFGSAGKA